MHSSFLHSSRARAAGMDIIESDTGEESNENQCNDPDENVIRLQVEESFWDQIKNKLDNVHIPDFLINLLEILGFGNVHSLSGVMDTKQSIDGQSVIQQIESFAQNDVPDMIEPKEYPKYFGAVTNPKKFRLAPGHKILIAKMSGAASDIIKGKNKQKFFCQPASKSAATVATETTSSQKYLAECEKLGDLITKRLEDSKIFDSKMAKGVVKKLVLTKDMESATVSCSLCNKDLKLRKANNRWTNIINFTRHCEQIHGKKKNNSSQKNVMDMMKQRETSEDLGSDFECNPDSPVRVEVLVHRSPHDSDDDDFNGKTPGRRKRVNPLLEDDENNNDVIECSSESSSSKKGKGTNTKTNSTWSRDARKKRKLEYAAEGTPKITNYFPILNELEVVVKENKRLRERMNMCLDAIGELQSQSELSVSPDAPHFLKVLVRTSNANLTKKKGGQRYTDEELKSFSDYLFVTGGRFTYETMYTNLKGCVPSLSTVERHMKSTSASIREGEFRFPELAQKIEKVNETNIVWFAEDSTRGIDCVEYDPDSNLLVGLVLPLDENGTPRMNVFKATSADAIQEIIEKEEVAGGIHCMMAQPVNDKSTPFCLMIVGTNGKFTHVDILKRWKWIVQEAKKYNIIVLGFSTDGDEKFLKAMRLITFPEKVNNPPEWADWFHADISGQQTTFAMQDYVHLVAKLKCLTKPNVHLPMGNYNASSSHLRILVKEQTKDLHGLTERDIDIRNKMNYRTAEKLCSKTVTEQLCANIPESQGTVAYLRIMRDVIAAFLDRSLTPLERVRTCWKSNFFLRIWRQWLLENNFSVRDCFVTLNAYHCLEVDSHVLIQLLRHLRDIGAPCSAFCIWKLSSQMCEGFFRQARALTTTLHTAINFTILDFLHRCKRIDLLNEVPVNLQENYNFPRSKRVMLLDSEEANFNSYPTDAEILLAVEEARKDALSLANDLGMDMPDYATNAFIDFSDPMFEGWLRTEDDDARLDLEETSDENPTETQAGTSTPADADASVDDVEEDLCVISSGAVGLKAHENVDLTPESPFVAVAGADGQRVIVRKRTLLWSLTNKRPLLSQSASRCERVKAPVPGSVSLAARPDRGNARGPTVEEEVSAGEWGIFTLGRKKVVGRIVSFCYTKAPTSYPLTCAAIDGKRKVSVLCDWYEASDCGELSHAPEAAQDLVDLKKSYVATMPRPFVADGKLFVSLAALKFLL